MMSNKKSSRMSAWKALYVIPLVGISLAATAETKVDYRYEGQQPAAVADTPKDKDTKKTFKEKNLHEGRFIIDEESQSVTMIYYDLEGNELKSQILGVGLNRDLYFINGNMATPKALEIAMEDEDAVLLTAYLKSGKKVRGAVTPEREFVSGTWDTSKSPEHQNITINNRKNETVIDATSNNPVVVINGERMPEGFDMSSIPTDEITSISVLKTEEALKEYDTEHGVIVITTDPSEKKVEKPVPDIYINGRKATSEDIQSLPANPKGTVAADGTVWFTTEEDTEKMVENKAPSFYGGSAAAFQEWVHSNIRYPEGTSAEGRLDVSFTVSETGKVTEVKVMGKSDSSLAAEAVRVIESSPEWSPALKDGKPVAIKMLIPVIFKK